MKSPFALLVLCCFMCTMHSGCGKQSGAGDHPPAAGEAANSGSATDQKPTMRFRTEICVDRTGTGTEAFRMLIPSDWKFSGGITWILDNPGMPATACTLPWRKSRVS